MAESAEAVRLPNPFSSAQREGRELTVKFVLWETLARHYPNGARVAELEKDERLLEMRPKMRAAKNLNGQITGELGSDKGVHFIKDFNGQPGVWGVRLDTAAAAAEQPRGGSTAPVPSAAPAQQQGAEAEVAAQQQQLTQAARGHKAAALPSPPVPGNESEAAQWAGASCQYLTDRLWKKGVAVWWPAEQQYFNGKIIETLSEEGGDLLLLHVLYDDQTDKWMRPTRFKVSGGKEQTVVVITENEVYIRDEASGRLVPDPNQGVDPTALGGAEAAGAGGAAAGGGSGAAAGCAAAAPGAAHQQQAQAQQQQQQQQSVRSAASQSSGGRGGRRPHAARAPGDIPTKGSWWQKAVVDEARALEIQQQRTSSSGEVHPQPPAAPVGGDREQRREGQQQQQQAQRPAGQVQQERKRKLAAGEAATERSQAQRGKPQAQQGRQHAGQRAHEQQHAEKRQRRESSAADEAPQQRKQPQGGEQVGRPPIPPSSEPVAPKFFSIPKRQTAEQPPSKQAAPAAAEVSKAKAGSGSLPFRIPKAGTGPSAAGPAAAGASAAERQGGKRAREPLEDARDQRQGRTEAERGQRAQHAPAPQQQEQQQQPHGRERQQHQHSHEQQQQHNAPPRHQQQQGQEQQQQGQERQQQRQPHGRSPEMVRREERATRDLILRHCKADTYKSLGEVRWAVPAEGADLPTPQSQPAAGAAAAPHKAALAERLAAGGPWPHGTTLLLAPDSAAASLAGTPAEAPLQPPEDAQFGRIFVCKRNTTSACFKRNVFVSNSNIDLLGLHPGSLALLHSLDEKLVYGWFRVMECGTNLDPGFPAEAAFKYHVRVQPLHLFQPVPDTMLDAFVDRKTHPKTGQKMKFFDRHLDARQCRQIWSLMRHYNEKLHDSRDACNRLSPFTPVGAGFWDALARQEARLAARAGGGGGGGGGGGEL